MRIEVTKTRKNRAHSHPAGARIEHHIDNNEIINSLVDSMILAS